MSRTAGIRLAALSAAGLALASSCAIGRGTEPTVLQSVTSPGGDADDAVLFWNAIALQAIATDHTGTLGAPEQGGPTRSSRALAIIHLAIYDAVNAIDGTHEPYLAVNLDPEILRQAAVDATVAQASYETLAALFPRQASTFATFLSRALQGIPKGRGEGVKVGHEAATGILVARASDGAAEGDTAIYPPTADPPLPGQHVPDPLNPDQGLITPGWGKVETFSGIDVTASGFRAPAPPGLGDPAYTSAFNEAGDLGGDGIITPTERTKEQTEIGIFWGYDGTAEIGTPPRFYNQIVRAVAKRQRNTLVENARLFALANMALADAGIACWDSKYYYNFWRPVVGIRQADLDGNAGTIQDENWTPLGAQGSNQSGNDFTPPFPAYPSGHAAFGAATCGILRRFYGTDRSTFRLTSDEMRGPTTDSAGRHRYTVVRRYDTFSQAAAENAQSRIYLGIHWQFDAVEGIIQGYTVADRVFATLLKPGGSR